MPRRSILSAAERESLLALPDTKDELLRHYTFSETDLSIIRQRRGASNRLGYAVQLCYLRFPGMILGLDEPPFQPLLKLVADQLKINIESWNEYGQREQTRREHLVELQSVFGFETFTMSHYEQAVLLLTELAMQTDKGIVLANALVEHLRLHSIILPALNAIERACAEAITSANRRIYEALVGSLSDAHRRRLDELLERRNSGTITSLAWLRQSPARPNSRHMLEHICYRSTWLMASRSISPMPIAPTRKARRVRDGHRIRERMGAHRDAYRARGRTPSRIAMAIVWNDADAPTA